MGGWVGCLWEVRVRTFDDNDYLQGSRRWECDSMLVRGEEGRVGADE